MRLLAHLAPLVLALAFAFAGASRTGAQGFHGAPETLAPGEAEAALEPVPFDSATTARYADTGRRLAAAVATGDAGGFRALHTEAGWAQADDWWKAMLANQKRSFGPVVAARGPYRRSIRAGRLGAGIPPDGAAVLLFFERGAGASLSFVLDDSGRVVRSSLWVLRELAGADTSGVPLLWAPPVTEGAR